MFRDLMIFNELRGISEEINSFGNNYVSQIVEAIEELEPQSESFWESFWPYVISFVVGALTTIATTWFVEKSRIYHEKNEELKGFRDSLNSLISMMETLKFRDEDISIVVYPEEVDSDKVVAIDVKSIAFTTVGIVEESIDNIISKGLVIDFDLSQLMAVKSYIANFHDGILLIKRQRGEVKEETFGKIQVLIDNSVESINGETIKINEEINRKFLKYIFKK